MADIPKNEVPLFSPDPASFERQNLPQLSAIPTADLLTSAGTR